MNDDKFEFIVEQLFQIRIALAHARVSTENVADIEWERSQFMKRLWENRIGEEL